MTGFPRKGGYRVSPERNLREDDDVANTVGLSQTEDRSPALSCPILQGHQISSFTNTVGATTEHITIPPGQQVTIPHGLQRKLVGWFLVRNGNSVGTGNTNPTEQASDENFLVLGNPSAVELRFDLWVY